MKIIKVTACNNCPFEGQCKAWKSLTRAQRLQITIGNSTPHNFILAKCHLDDDPDAETNEQG